MTIYQNEVGKQFTFTITDQTGTAVDLTGSTCTMSYRQGAAGPVTNKTLTLITPPSGICRYTSVANDFAPGEYTAQIKVALSGGNIHETGTFNISCLLAIA